MWKEDYSTWVTIENRSLIPQRFKVRLAEDLYSGAKFESMGNDVEDAFYVKNDNQPHSELKLWKHERDSIPLDIVMGPLMTSEPVSISTANTRWDWLPRPHEDIIPSEIATAFGLNAGDDAEEIIKALMKLKVELNATLVDAVSDGPGKFNKAIKTFSKLKGLFDRIGDIAAIYKALSPEEPWVVAKTGTHKMLMTGYGEAFDAKRVRMDAAPRLTPEANAVQGTFAQGDAVQIFQFRPDDSLQVQVDVNLGPGDNGYWVIVTVADDFVEEYGYRLVFGDSQPVTVGLPTADDYFLLLTNWAGDGVPFELTVNGLAPASEGARVTQAIVNGGRSDRSNVHLVEFALEGNEDWQGLIDRGEITQVVELYRLSESAARVELTADRYVRQDEEKRLSVDLSIDGLGGSRQSLLADGRYELALRGDVVIDEDGVDDGRHRIAFHQLAGDFDGDAATTGGDLALWTDHFGAIGAPGAGVADGNADGATGGFDFLMWQRNFGAVAEFAAAAEIAAGPPAATLAPAEDLPVATGRDVGGPLALAGAASAAERPADGARPWRRGEWLPDGWGAPGVAARAAAFAEDDGLRVPSSGEPPRVPEAVVRQYLAQRTAASGGGVRSTASRADGVTVRQGVRTQDEALERLGNSRLENPLPGAVRQVED